MPYASMPKNLPKPQPIWFLLAEEKSGKIAIRKIGKHLRARKTRKKLQKLIVIRSKASMAAQVSKKMKLAMLALIGTITTGIFFVYQKLFGGKPQPLPNNQYIVGEKNRLTVSPSPIEEEIVAVSYSENIAQGISEVIKKTGNLDFIKPGQKVLVKPNVNSDDLAPATTHPESVAEVVRLAKAKGAYVIVGDRSNPNWKTIPAMKKTGIYNAAIQAGADEIVGFDDEEWIRVAPEKAGNWPNGFRIPKRLEDLDHIISVPVLHTHSIAGHSLAIKNLVGLIHPADRMVFHASPKRDEMIAEISLAIKPSLTVIDGTKAFIEKGPSRGTLADTKVYLAAKDVLTADVIGVYLLKKHGAQLFWDDPWEARQIKHFLSLRLSPFTQEKIQAEALKI